MPPIDTATLSLPVRRYATPLPARPARPASAGLSAGLIYGTFAVSMLASAVLMACAGLTIDPASLSNLPYLLVVLAAAAMRLGLARGGRRARAVGRCAEYYALLTGLALMGAVTSYPVAALTRGYADPWLQRTDLLLHFDWLAWYEMVVRHRSLQLLGIAAYESIYLTPAIMLAWFAWHGQQREAHRFFTGFWLSAILSLALFALMPAVGPFSFLWHHPIAYMPVSELWQPDLIPALRAHRVHVVDVGQLRGLVSAPSFHAVCAVLFGVTAWRIRPLRWPLLALIGAMALATPVEGTHYLIDIVIGVAVALVSLAGGDVLFAWGSRRRSVR